MWISAWILVWIFEWTLVWTQLSLDWPLSCLNSLINGLVSGHHNLLSTAISFDDRAVHRAATIQRYKDLKNSKKIMNSTRISTDRTAIQLAIRWAPFGSLVSDLYQWFRNLILEFFTPSASHPPKSAQRPVAFQSLHRVHIVHALFVFVGRHPRSFLCTILIESYQSNNLINFFDDLIIPFGEMWLKLEFKTWMNEIEPLSNHPNALH